MKKSIKVFLIIFIAIFMLSFHGCKEDEMYTKEVYHPVLYLLNNDNYNVYNAVFSFNDETATGYFSIGCGGSRKIPEEVVVELEEDTVLLNNYNRLNFITDTASFAIFLPKSRFDTGVLDTTITFPANYPQQYVKVPMKIDHHGLSPDSTYFIPINIKSISKYELNKEKRNILFRVLVENDYAEQINTTTYYQRGQKIAYDPEVITPFNGSKILQPISKNEVRFFAGTELQSNETTYDEIVTHSLILKINTDSTTTVRPFGTIEVEQVERENYNRFYTTQNSEGKEVQYFDVCYKYRVQTSPGIYSKWYEMRETLERMPM